MIARRYSFPDNTSVEHFAHALGTLGLPFQVNPHRTWTDIVILDHKEYLLDISFFASAHGCFAEHRCKDIRFANADLTFLIDRDGKLWKGPSHDDENLHWAYFDGYMVAPPFDPIWILTRSAMPEHAMKVSYEFALEYALLRWEREQ